VAVQWIYDELKNQLIRLWMPLGMRGSEDFFTLYLDLSAEVELGCRKYEDGLSIRISSSQTYIACHSYGGIELEYSYSLDPPPMEEQIRVKAQFVGLSGFLSKPQLTRKRSGYRALVTRRLKHGI
jgi:hypothetical protein